jgi:protocatechuate 3,4-dioxygenase beta subunit
LDRDDIPVGRILSRREAMALLAAAGGSVTLGDTARRFLGGLSSASGIPSAALKCVVRPEMTVGPYFLEQMLERSDIRTEPSTGTARPGVPFALEIGVVRVDGGSCAPIPGVVVDLWQCDADGVYSGVQDIDGQFDSRGTTYLRGYQRTDRQGKAAFTTIFPGWYPGRSPHIHLKLRHPASPTATYEFTSQLYFDDRFVRSVYANAPYHPTGEGFRTNAQDGPYTTGHGEQLLVDVRGQGDRLTASFLVGLDLSDRAKGEADVWAGRTAPPPRG